jgi:hypothetical protein
MENWSDGSSTSLQVHAEELTLQVAASLSNADDLIQFVFSDPSLPDRLLRASFNAFVQSRTLVKIDVDLPKNSPRDRYILYPNLVRLFEFEGTPGGLVIDQVIVLPEDPGGAARLARTLLLLGRLIGMDTSQLLIGQTIVDRSGEWGQAELGVELSSFESVLAGIVPDHIEIDQAANSVQHRVNRVILARSASLEVADPNLERGGVARVPLDADDFEHVCAEFMRSIGFSDAQRTSASRDGGVDVVSVRAVAQAKFFSNSKVGPDVILQLAGSRQEFEVEYALCFSWATGYTSAALEKARRLKIFLFQFNPERFEGCGFDRVF